jgi:hypothetical protein
MTANDKTGQKLVDSMRKSKAAAADKAGATQTASQQSQKKKSPAQTRKKTATQRGSVRSANQGGDPYQSGRRIWPD